MKKILLTLLLILFLAAFLRLFKISSAPPSLNWDEVSHGYNAYSIITTGKDEWGQQFPFTAFRAYGDYKLPLYIYLTAPFTLLGLNELTVRLVSIISGICAVGLSFFLTQYLFKNYKISLLSSFLLAISPWHILLSRAAFEANLALFLVILATWLFFKGLAKRTFLPLAFLTFGLTFYSYNSAKVFTPLFVFSLVIIYRKELLKNVKIFLLSLILFLILFTPHLILLPTAQGQARVFWSSILDQGAINQINELRTTSNLPLFVPVVFYNKPVYLVSHFLSNWVSHFSPKYLFLEGGSNFQYSIPHRGIMYAIEAPFLLIGLFALLISRKKGAILVLVWFAIGPIASSLTRDSPNVLRSILTLPSPQIICAFGFITFFSFVRNRKYHFFAWGLFLTVLAVSFASFAFDYFGQYRENYSFAWQYGYKEVAKFVGKNYHSYDRIIVSKKYGEPHEFLLFYLQWPPEKFQKDPNLVRYFRSNWYWVDRFDKFYFVNDWEINEVVPKIKGDKKTLLISSPDNYPHGAKKLETVKFLDGKEAFDIFEL